MSEQEPSLPKLGHEVEWFNRLRTDSFGTPAVQILAAPEI